MEIDLQAADRCVKCGLCLPHCPTYRISRDEGEGPRGRLALMQAVGRGRLAEDDDALRQHLDGCLDCRSCERVCPAQVPYGRLLDQVRSRVRPREGALTRLLRRVVTRPGLMRTSARLLRGAQASKVLGAVRRGLLGPTPARLSRRLLPIPPVVAPTETAPATRPPNDAASAPVGLFTGCIAGSLDSTSLQGLTRLAAALGIELKIPERQTCCGALHMHAGDASGAAALAARNRDAFRDAGVAEVLNLTSGCGAHLQDYPDRFPDGGHEGLRYRDALAFLVEQGLTERLRFRPLAARALLHLPCTQRNVLRSTGPTREALAAIRGLSLEWPAGAPECCGAAGSYFITEADRSDRVLAETLERMPDPLPDYLLSSNIGCAMQLGGELRARGHAIEVLHPVSLLARQMEEA